MPGNKICICGLISDVKKIITKTNREMFFIKIEDISGKIEVIVFPNTAEQCSSIMQKDKIVLLSGRVDCKDGVTKLIAETIEELVEE